LNVWCAGGRGRQALIAKALSKEFSDQRGQVNDWLKGRREPEYRAILRAEGVPKETTTPEIDQC
jgi:hypothetical protein